MTTTTHAYPGAADVQRVQMDNGITVLVRENHFAPVAVLEGYLLAGSIHDPADRAGLASFVASLVTRGSQHYDFDGFNDAVESVGASISVGGGSHVTNFSSESLAEDFPHMVELLADVLRRPVFPAQQVERVRGQWLVRLQEREQNTRSMAFRRFNEILFDGHPYSRPTSGYTESVAAIDREEILNFHRDRYTPAGAIIVVCGDVDSERVVDLIDEHFGDWQGPAADQTLPPVSPLDGSRREEIAMPGKVQSDIVVGCQAIRRTDPDYYAVQVANNILGQFGLMGRLGEVVRERQGLAYYSYSTLDTDVGVGSWLAMAGVNPQNVEKAVQSILAEFERLGSEPVSAEELSDSKANLTGALPLRLETNDGVASHLLAMEWYGLGLDYLEKYGERINAVSQTDVQRVAGTYLRPDAYALVVAGPEVGQNGGAGG